MRPICIYLQDRVTNLQVSVPMDPSYFSVAWSLCSLKLIQRRLGRCGKAVSNVLFYKNKIK